MTNLPDQAAFVSVVKALTPYLDEIVFAGAWAHRLFRFHPLAKPPEFAPLMSGDADVALPEELPERTAINELLTEAGFKEKMTGSGPIPATSYHLESAGLYVEFIAPLKGSELDRNGEPDRMLAIAGVTAAKLRFVDLLFVDPWKLSLTKADGFDGLEDDVRIRVAGPTSYLAQKVLTIRRRNNEQKKSKDVLYVFDTLNLFAPSLAELKPDAHRLLARLPEKTCRTFDRLRNEIFQDAGLLTSAAVIAQASGRSNPPSPAVISSVCRIGLATVFGT